MPPHPKTTSKTTTADPVVPVIPAAPQTVLSKYLDKTKDEHFNYIPDINYLVSTGSLNLDSEIGGFGPGMTRLVGPASAGKSSFALNVARNFLVTVPHSRVLFIKSEARLSREIQERAGLTFVKTADHWKEGTVFVFECNVYEVIIGLLRELISNNPDDCRYMVILDSMDGLNLRDDITKTVDQANRVAGQPLMTKQFLQKVSVAMTKHGHLCFFLSQVSADIKLDPYAKGAPRQVGGSGGNAIQHFASHVLTFQEWYEGDLILTDPEARADRIKNRPLGHICKIKLTKTDREKRYITVEIPIKHGVVKGNAIWREREIADQLLVWGLITKGGSWLSITDTLRKELGEHNLAADLPEKVQGLNQLYALLEARPELTEYLFKRFKALISGSTPVSAEPSV